MVRRVAQLLFASLFAFPAASFADPGPGVVSHIKVLSDKVPDVSSLDAWKSSFIKDSMTDEEKAMAIWRTVKMFQHQDAPPVEYLQNENIVQDAIKIFNVYGYSFCGVATGDVQALAGHVGLRSRGWTINAHVVPEIFFDGDWRLFDSSLITYFPKPDGKPANVEEIVANVSGWLDKHPGLRGNGAALQDYQFRGPGWKTGPDLLRACPTYTDQGWLPANTHGWYSTMQEYDGSVKSLFEPGFSTGYQVNIQLRKGEKLTRNWSNKGLHVNGMHNESGPPGSIAGKIGEGNFAYAAKDGDLAPGRIGNGLLEYDVPLADGSFRAGALVAENLTARAESTDEKSAAIRVKDAAADGVLILRMPSSYVYLTGALTIKPVLSDGASIAIDFSDNNGLDWKQVARITTSGEQKIDLSPLALRRYDYRLKFTLKGAGAGLDGVKITHDIQHSQRSLPALATGENTIRFASEAQEGTITVEGSTNASSKGKQLVYTDFHPTVTNLKEPSLSCIEPGGQITFPISTPGNITRLRFGAAYRARDARGGWDYQVSLDAGKTFKTVARAAGPVAGSTKYVTITEIPAGTREALVRFAGQTASNATIIFNFRIDADYAEPHGAFAPIKTTYSWEESGTEKQDVHISRKPNETYTITCAGKPTMKSITLERAE